MDVFDAITTRVSVTKYRSEGIEREKIARLLEAGQWAPSAGNMQATEYILIEDDELKEKISQYARNQPHVREAPVVIVVLADVAKAERQYGDRGKNLYAVQETAAAMQNMMLEAHNMDLGAAWVGAFEEEPVRDLLYVPERLRPVAIVTVGHPMERPEQPPRRDIANMAFINRYGERVTPIYDKIVWEGLREYGEQAKQKLGEIKDRYTE